MVLPSSYKKAVILGAAGFIGINLANLLSEHGYQLICFDRKPSPHWPKNAKAIIGDFANMPIDLVEALDNAIVFHLISSCRPSPNTALASQEVNYDLATTLRYLEATRMRSLRWVFLSSGGTVYGQQDVEFIPETSPTDPICSYGLVKVTMEKYFALYGRVHNIDYVITRLANPYGPWQHPLQGQGIVAALTYKALKGDTIEIWGDGSNVRDYIYISDAVQGILTATLFGGRGEIYNIGTSKGHSITQLIELIQKILEKELKINYTTERAVDLKRNVLDIKKITTHTSWRPLTAMHRGITTTLSWIEKNIESW